MPGGYGQQPGIILLREGTDTSQGKAQLISNINACGAVVDAVRSTLGPRGMDKLMYDGTKVTISNDGATIMKLLDIVHPAARVVVFLTYLPLRPRRASPKANRRHSGNQTRLRAAEAS